MARILKGLRITVNIEVILIDFFSFSTRNYIMFGTHVDTSVLIF
jgi:hypothetical protein